MSVVMEWIEQKKKCIIEELEHFFSTDEAKSRLQSMNIYPIFSNILKIGNHTDKVKERVFDNPDELMKCIDVYMMLMDTINRKVTFVPSKENFCMFMGWTVKNYAHYMEDAGEEMSCIMQIINDYLIENQISAAQTGLLGTTITKFRQQLAGEHGQGMVTQKEQNEEDRSKKKELTPEDIARNMMSMGVELPKGMISNKKKMHNH